MFDKTIRTVKMMWWWRNLFFSFSRARFSEKIQRKWTSKLWMLWLKKKTDVEMLKCCCRLNFLDKLAHATPPPPSPQESLLAALVGWKNPCCLSWPDCWLPLGLQGGGLYVMYIFLHIYVILMDVSTVLSPYAFSICDTSGPEYKDYEYGGIGRQIKTTSSLLNFVS